MFRVLLEDMKAKSVLYYGSYDTRKLFRMLVTDGTSAVVLFRLSKFLQKTHLLPLGILVAKFNELLNQIIIGRNARFGPGLVIVHSFGTVINGSVVAGRNIIIEHGVTIGSEKGRSPVLGDNIFIGAGAKIIGNVRIGNNVKIGANAVVVKDVVDDVTVVGVPARVVRRAGKPVA